LPGTIGGTVRSSGGFPSAGGAVMATNEATGESWTVQTTGYGDYEFKDLAPGTYKVVVKTPGFTEGSGKTEPGVGPLDIGVRALMAWEPLYPVFRWLFQTGLGNWVRESTWAVAYLEVFHLMGLTVLLGSSIAIGLRLSGIGMRSLPTAEVAREIRPYMRGALILIVLTGLPILASEAEKMFQSRPFELKMFYFALANICQFGAVGLLVRAKEGSTPILGKLASLLSVVLWFVVGWQGRAIAFF
jgi:hypothetical protein